jgi:hypothetical protein
MSPISPVPLIVAVVVSVAALAGASLASELEVSFDEVEAGALPAGWRIDATNPEGRLADWSVARRAEALSAPNVLALTKVHDGSGGVFNLCWNPTIAFRDGELAVSVRADAGRTDQGGGPIWRARDPDNYYVARYNPLERNFRIYYVKNGRRRQLASAGGLHIEGWIDGRKLLEVEDSTFADAGGVGVWTKADAATAFDDLTIRDGG